MFFESCEPERCVSSLWMVGAKEAEEVRTPGIRETELSRVVNFGPSNSPTDSYL